MTRVEQRNIRAQTGVELPLIHAGSYCPALTMLKQCGVYEVRPIICRIWGAVASMRCGYGCVPEGGYLSEREAYALLAEVADISGDTQGAARFRAAVQADPDEVARFMRADQKGRDLAYLEKTKRPGAVHVNQLMQARQKRLES